MVRAGCQGPDKLGRAPASEHLDLGNANTALNERKPETPGEHLTSARAWKMQDLSTEIQEVLRE